MEKDNISIFGIISFCFGFIITMMILGLIIDNLHFDKHFDTICYFGPFLALASLLSGLVAIIQKFSVERRFWWLSIIGMVLTIVGTIIFLLNAIKLASGCVSVA